METVGDLEFWFHNRFWLLVLVITLIILTIRMTFYKHSRSQKAWMFVAMLILILGSVALSFSVGRGRIGKPTDIESMRDTVKFEVFGVVEHQGRYFTVIKLEDGEYRCLNYGRKFSPGKYRYDWTVPPLDDDYDEDFEIGTTGK